MTETMIDAQGLTKRYGDVVALRDVSFQVSRGEVLGFLGPNGAGKSTAMRILTCFIAPSEGTARIAGHDIFGQPLEVRHQIGYLPESNPLYGDMLVSEYLGFVARLRKLQGGVARQRIDKAVGETHLEDVFHREIRTLSKGYRQRVGLAAALLHEPPLLILDEPMSGLDPNQAVEIRELIRRIGEERTVILSTHNLAEVQVTCSRVLIIAKGRLVADDTPEGLMARAGKARFEIVVAEKDGVGGEAVRDALAALPQSENVVVRAADGEIVADVVPKDGGEDLRAELFRLAVDKGWTLLGLSRQGQNLEAIFRELTHGAAPQASSDDAGGTEDQEPATRDDEQPPEQSAASA